MGEPALKAARQASFRSVPEMWNHRVGSTPDLPALVERVDGRWEQLTWREADERVRAIAQGLLARGLKAEQRCAVLAATSVEWILADVAILSAGGATTTIHPSQTVEECCFMLRDSGSVLAFCDDDAQVAKVLARRHELPDLRGVVVFDGERSDDGFVTSLADLEAEGLSFGLRHPSTLDDVQRAVTPDRLATLIYTSGTTGQPKGVELTHDAWIYESEAIDRLGVLGPDDKQLLFLPLAHVFAKVMEVTFIRLGITTAVDGNTDRVLVSAQEIRPTWMAAVPRMFERAYNRIVGEARDRGPVAWATFRWALTVGQEVSRLRRTGRRLPPHLRLQHALADRLVFAPVREAFGGRLRFLVSGGAPLPVDIATFFDACGILICEGYGLTESGAASCVNTPDDVRFGTVGRPLPGCEVRIAPDGEIQLRSRGVMKGYHHLPEATEEAFTDDGWLRTGDVGRILASGHVQITDRKKDIIVTASGKNVAPARVQSLLRARCPFVAHALVHGDGRNFVTALIALDPDALLPWAEREGVAHEGFTDLVARPEVTELVQQAIDDVNRELPGWEQVRKFALVPAPFTVDDGTLTPSLKPKRPVIEARYAPILQAFYEGSVARI